LLAFPRANADNPVGSLTGVQVLIQAFERGEVGNLSRSIRAFIYPSSITCPKIASSVNQPPPESVEFLASGSLNFLKDVVLHLHVLKSKGGDSLVWRSISNDHNFVLRRKHDGEWILHRDFSEDTSATALILSGDTEQDLPTLVDSWIQTDAHGFFVQAHCLCVSSNNSTSSSDASKPKPATLEISQAPLLRASISDYLESIDPNIVRNVRSAIYRDFLDPVCGLIFYGPKSSLRFTMLSFVFRFAHPLTQFEPAR
jgi:hypothetical protein